MSFRDVGNAANEAQMARFAMAGALGFESLLRESKNPGADVHDFCKKIREASSIQGKRALESWGADSDDYIHLAGWMNSMASWLKRCEAFGNLLGMHPQDEVYLKGAAPLMGLLHVWNQTISLAVSDEEPRAA